MPPEYEPATEPDLDTALESEVELAFEVDELEFRFRLFEFTVLVFELFELCCWPCPWCHTYQEPLATHHRLLQDTLACFPKEAS